MEGIRGFVLSLRAWVAIFDKVEQSLLDSILSRAGESLRVMLLEGLKKAMNQFQKRG
jgi:hypothetical protein